MCPSLRSVPRGEERKEVRVESGGRDSRLGQGTTAFGLSGLLPQAIGGHKQPAVPTLGDVTVLETQDVGLARGRHPEGWPGV